MKLTAKQFCRVALALGEEAVADVADTIRPESMPDLTAIHEAAEEMADKITPHASTLPAHARLMDIAEWAEGAS